MPTEFIVKVEVLIERDSWTVTEANTPLRPEPS